MFVCLSGSGDPPWILKRDGLERYGWRLMSLNSKTMRIALIFFFWQIFSSSSSFQIFWRKIRVLFQIFFLSFFLSFFIYIFCMFFFVLVLVGLAVFFFYFIFYFNFFLDFTFFFKQIYKFFEMLSIMFRCLSHFKTGTHISLKTLVWADYSWNTFETQ